MAKSREEQIFFELFNSQDWQIFVNFINRTEIPRLIAQLRATCSPKTAGQIDGIELLTVTIPNRFKEGG